MSQAQDNQLLPYTGLCFHISFKETVAGGGQTPSKVDICSGSFSEVSGLEASMEVKEIKQGGHNYGVIQRVGQTTFSTVVLKRGMTSNRQLWRWYRMVANGGYAHRVSVDIAMRDHENNDVIVWNLHNALPVKFKAGDLNAKGGEVAIEEIHLAHEGLSIVKPKDKNKPKQTGNKA